MVEKVTGAQIAARLTALEGFTRMLIQREIKRDPDGADDFLNELSRASKDEAKQMDHREITVHNDIHTDDFIESIRKHKEQAE